MCGIAGFVYKGGRTTETTAEAVRMLAVQRHRGPDDAGLRSFSLATARSVEHDPRRPAPIEPADGLLGFNRLSIVDLSVNGHQPMCALNGQVMLTFNGEIYNALDFVPDLRASGVQFRGHSDTEVILHLYLEYGFQKMMGMLNGMFAIVLVDLRLNTIFIARDRFGIKPMYIYETPEILAFSSELKSFYELAGFDATLNQDLLSEYLIFRHVLHDTLLNGVRSVVPGTYEEHQHAGHVRVHSFYDINQFTREPRKLSFTESVARVDSTLSASVKRQMISDVKLGCQLSGGVDSSLVTWKAAGFANGNFETVSIVLDDSRFNESPFMDVVAQRLNVLSHRFRLEPEYYWRHLEKATWHLEAPINHPNSIGIYLLSQQARQHVTVLLSGEGADEVFGGYERFAAVLHPGHWRNLITSVRQYRAKWPRYWGSLASRSVWASSFLNPDQAETLMPGFSVLQALAKRERIFESLAGSPFDRLVKYEVKTYLPDLLTRQDKMSMAHSIENRVPFLDHELVDLTFSIPEKHLHAGPASGDGKRVLKELAAGVFGDAFAWRQKQGFGIPLRQFFSSPDFRAYLAEVISPGIRDFGLFDYRALERLMKRATRLSSQDLDMLWILISFEIWRQQFLQRKVSHG